MASSYPVGGGVVGGVPGQDPDSSQISQPNQPAAPSQSQGQTYHDQQSLLASPQQQRQLPAYQSHHTYQTHQPSTEQIEASAAATAAAAAAAAVAVASDGLAALQQATALSSSNVVPETPTYSPLVSGQAQYSMSPAGGTSQSTPSHSKNQTTNSAKASRLRRACDLCSQRKVKCDESGPPCRPCRDLNIECTFERAMKRRGPPNKHAEAAKAAKRPRLEPTFHPAIQAHTRLQPAMSPNPHNAAEALVSIAGRDLAGGLGAEAIAPWPVLEYLVQDFFTYIHPLAPFPHEPTFKKQWQNREDKTNPDFLALMASMIGCLVASFPRTARIHLKSQQSSNLFPRAITMIERCRLVALEARGPLFMSKEEVNVYDAATSYFLGLAAGYTMQWKLCRRFMTETLSFIRELGYHKKRDLGSSMYGVTYRGPPFDHVQDQLGKRIFWVMFLGVRSMAQLGAPHSEIVLPPFTPSEPRPDYPLEVDDEYILPDHIMGQPEGTVSLLTGFVRAIKVYETMNALVSVELAYGLSSLAWPEQRQCLHNCLQEAKTTLYGIPHELYLDMDSPNGAVGSGDVFQDTPGYHYHPPAYPDPQPRDDIRHVLVSQPMRRRLLQYEIQKANIYTSQIATRSHFVERYLNLRDANREHAAGYQQPAYAGVNGTVSNGAVSDDSKVVAAAAVHAVAAHTDDVVDEEMKEERELIVKNLLVVITSLPQQNMEPNGASLINKIRQVASTLLNDAPYRKGPLAIKNEEYLARFLGILTRLEKTVPANGGLGAGLHDYQGVAMTAQDEEEELRNWADLREHQLRFANQGGFLTNL